MWKSVFIFALLVYVVIDFVKSSGTLIVAINMPEIQKMNGKILKHIAGNGPADQFT